MKTYFKILGIALLFSLQYIFVLPYYFSSNNWWEFLLGWFILLVIDPIIIWKLTENYRIKKEVK